MKYEFYYKGTYFCKYKLDNNWSALYSDSTYVPENYQKMLDNEYQKTKREEKLKRILK